MVDISNKPKESRLNNSIRNVLFGLMKYSVSLILPFILRTVMIKRYGAEYAGLGSLFSSILQVLNLSELGFSNAVVFSLYKPIAEEDIEKVQALMQLYRRIYKAVGISIAVLGIIICPFVKVFIGGYYPENINVYVLFILFLVNTSFSYIFFGYRSAILVSSQRSDIDSRIQIVSSLICYFLELLVLIFTRNYYLYVLCMIIGTAVNNGLLLCVTNGLYDFKVEARALSKREKNEIYQNVGALFGHQLDSIIINSIDSIVISMFLGLHMLTTYNNYYYIMNALMSVLILIANSFTASIGNSIALRTVEVNYDNFISFEYLIGNLNIICSAMLIAFYQEFISLWMGKDYLLDLDIVILIAFMFYIRQTRRAVLVFKDANGMWKSDALKPYISSIANLLLNITLVKIIGLKGILISTIVCMMCIEFPWEGYVLYSEYFKRPIREYYGKQVAFLVKGVVVSISSYSLLSHFWCNTWGSFAIKLLLGGMITVLLTGVIGMIDEENRKIVSIIMDRIKHYGRKNNV